MVAKVIPAWSASDRGSSFGICILQTNPLEYVGTAIRGIVTLPVAISNAAKPASAIMTSASTARIAFTPKMVSTSRPVLTKTAATAFFCELLEECSSTRLCFQLGSGIKHTALVMGDAKLSDCLC